MRGEGAWCSPPRYSPGPLCAPGFAAIRAFTRSLRFYAQSLVIDHRR